MLERGRNLGQGFQVYDQHMTRRERNRPGYAEREAKATTDAALRWIDQHGAESFLLLVHYFDAHLVYDPPQAFRQRFADPQDRALLSELRWINQRRSVIWRIAHFLVEHQRRYLETGDELGLRPLAQAELARALGQASSTISRALRGKYLDTPHGTLALSFFCQHKGDVVRRLHARHPDWPDRRLRQELEARYGCRISRRTVAYHRGAG